MRSVRREQTFHPEIPHKRVIVSGSSHSLDDDRENNGGGIGISGTDGSSEDEDRKTKVIGDNNGVSSPALPIRQEHLELAQIPQ